MSSTSRGGKRSEADFYPTPRWAVVRMLERERVWLEKLPRWLEPSAGDGAIIRAVRDNFAVQWTALELREKCRSSLLGTGASRVIIRDALSTEPWPASDVVIMNPPFSLAEAFVKKALATEGVVVVVVLLRLNWLGTEGRHAFLSSCMPDIYVLPNRPDFAGNGGDSCEYAWFVFYPGSKRDCGRVFMLDLTPNEERKAAKAEVRKLYGVKKRLVKVKKQKLMTVHQTQPRNLNRGR